MYIYFDFYFDICFFFVIYSNYLFQVSQIKQIDHSYNYKRLQQTAELNKLQIVDVESDGDCFFPCGTQATTFN